MGANPTPSRNTPPAPNKKQCSRQLQCEVPCAGNVVNSSMFVNSSLSSLSSTSHAVHKRGFGQGGFRHGVGWGRGRGVRKGRRQGTFHPPCHILHYHIVLRPEGTSHNYERVYFVLLLAVYQSGSRASCVGNFAEAKRSKRRFQ